jgi:Uma2 family endonuclease
VALEHSYDVSMSFEEYLALVEAHPDVRFEYIGGYVYMMAGGTLDHAKIIANITGLLYQSLLGKDCSVYSFDTQLCLADNQRAYPDVTIGCDPREDGRSTTLQYPRVVVEVLSPGTRTRDRGEKFFLYREYPSIEEILLVDSERPVVELCRRERQNLWSLHRFNWTDTIELTSVDVVLSVAALYRGIQLSESIN